MAGVKFLRKFGRMLAHTSVVNNVIGLLVLALILRRQLRVRPVREDGRVGIRGLTGQVLRDAGGQALRKGTAITAGLWIGSIVLHVVADVWVDKPSDVAGLGTSTITVYLAITWAVQGYVVRERADRLAM